ncbi:hypothetical protein BD410DRAFT_721555, partial [Rickenella mellea]
GFALALVIEACIAHQRQERSANGIGKSRHPDPIHVSAHFLRTTAANAKFEVRVQTIKVGRGFTNVVGELMQKGLNTITAHIIFGVLSNTAEPGVPALTLAPPSPYARRIPLNVHPSRATPTVMTRPWNFKHHVGMAEDASIAARNTRTGDESDKEDERTSGMEWGAWFELTGKGERITPASLAFFGDIFKSLPELIPKEERKGLGISWFPTMTMAIEFKAPIPTASSGKYSSRTVGLYHNGKFLHDPQGRHDAYVEVWTAPSEIGCGGEEEGWKGEQRCLAVATQMGLTVPVEVNLRRASKL